MSACIHPCSSGLDVRYNLLSDVGAYYAARLLQVFYYKMFVVLLVFFRSPLRTSPFSLDGPGFEHPQPARLALYCDLTLEMPVMKCDIAVPFYLRRTVE